MTINLQLLIASSVPSRSIIHRNQQHNSATEIILGLNHNNSQSINQFSFLFDAVLTTMGNIFAGKEGFTIVYVPLGMGIGGYGGLQSYSSAFPLKGNLNGSPRPVKC